jgi:hypothetical protein
MSCSLNNAFYAIISNPFTTIIFSFNSTPKHLVISYRILKKKKESTVRPHGMMFRGAQDWRLGRGFSPHQHLPSRPADEKRQTKEPKIVGYQSRFAGLPWQKVKLPLCLVKQHVTTRDRIGGMASRSQHLVLYAPQALPPGKETLVPIRLGGP